MDIEKVVPKAVEVTIKSETLTIKPFKFAQLPKVFKLIQPILDTLNTLQGQSRPALIAAIIAEHGDRVVELVKMTTGKDQAWADELDMDEGASILGAILEVNLDFFIKGVLPTIVGRINKATPTGQTSS